MQLRAPASPSLQPCPALHMQTSQRHRLCFRASSQLAVASCTRPRTCRAMHPRGQACHTIVSPAWQSRNKRALLCHAAQPPNNFGNPASAANSPSSSTPDNASADDSRQASNAAASTSASQAASGDEQGSNESGFKQLLSQPAKVLAAFFERFLIFLRGLPAFIQREKLQRLHKKALDEPTNAERYSWQAQFASACLQMCAWWQLLSCSKNGCIKYMLLS